MNIALILITNFILSWTLTKFLIKPFKKIIPDIPNKRSSHNLIKPRGGGLSFLITNLITSNIFNQVNFLSLMPLSLTGFADDFYNISREFRIVIQLTTSFFILFESNYLDFIQNINNFGAEFLIITLIIFISTGVINFCNFMDGIDGILSGTILTFYLFAALIISNSIWGIGIPHSSVFSERETKFFSLGMTSPCAIRKPIDVFLSFCKNLGIPNLSIAPHIP